MGDDLQVPPRFFFGAMSPYSWFAAERIERLLPQAQWRGVLAGAIFKAHGRVSWGLTEHRADGIADCQARAAEYRLGPIRWPEPWPTSDLLIARAMAFADRLEVDGAIAVDGGHGSLKPFALAAMRLAFLEGANLADAEAVLEAGRRTGIDANELQQALDDPVVKDALRSTTAEALALGVFGVPTIAVEGQLFWGDDRLRDAVAACGSPRGGRSADQLGGRSPAGERSISS
jgi:2-hydroxychromene-2-carboxylate isomerase